MMLLMIMKTPINQIIILATMTVRRREERGDLPAIEVLVGSFGFTER